jgi:hypothetical protein
MKPRALLESIREAIRQQRFRISQHANEEMSDDDLTSDDVECIILKGKVARRFTADPRGTRYEILGPAVDDRMAYVVCRFLSDGTLLVVTVFAAGDENQ